MGGWGELIAPSQPVIRYAMSTVPTSIPEEWCHLSFHHPTDSLLPPGMEDSASEEGGKALSQPQGQGSTHPTPPALPWG